MNPSSVFSLRPPVRGILRTAAAARTFSSLLAVAALTLPAAHSALAQAPGTVDPGFAPAKVAATIYSLLFTNYGTNDPRNFVLAAGDGSYDENLQPNGVIKGNFVQPTFGAPGRTIFTAVPERVASPGSAVPKILLGGIFGQSASQVANHTPAQNITRIQPDGTQDTGFVAGVNGGSNGFVTSILPLANGKIVVGGQFTTFNLEKRLRIVRLLNNGAIDESFSASSLIDDDVLALAEGISPTTGAVDGTTLVGGTFNHVGGQSVTKLARLDANGNLDPTFKPVIDTRVIAITVQPTGKIIIGGEFTKINGTAVSRIARLNYDGSLDNTFSGSVTGLPSGEPNPVAVYVFRPLSNGKIYVGGNFTQIGGVTRRYLGVINPNGTVGAFDPGTTIYDKVQSIFVQPNGRVLVGETLGPKIGKNYQPTFLRLFGATTFN